MQPGAETERTRRDFFRQVAVGAAAAAAVGVLPKPAEARARRSRGATRTAYRLSTRGHDACNACVEHARHRFFRTPKAAVLGRAHRGCDCHVVEHPLPVGTYQRYFHRKRDVFDVRWGPPVGRGKA